MKLNLFVIGMALYSTAALAGSANCTSPVTHLTASGNYNALS